MASELEVGKITCTGGADAVSVIKGTTTAARLDLQTNSHHRFMQVVESDGRFRIYDQTADTERFTIASTGAVSIPSASGTQIALTVKGGNNLVDNIALNVTNQAGDTGTNIRNNGQLFTSTLATFSSGINLSSGNILIGKTVTDDTETGSVLNATQMRQSAAGTVAHDFHDFYRGTAGSLARVGHIRTTGTATSYNTSSDYRLKENLEPFTGALDRIDQLPVYRFNFTADPETTVDGFVAHEVQAHVPEAITGEKDAMRTVVVQEAVEAQPATYYEEGDELPEGKAVGDEKTPAVEAVEEVTEEQPDYQGIDQSKLVPLLVAAVKELKAKVEALEGGE